MRSMVKIKRSAAFLMGVLYWLVMISAQILHHHSGTLLLQNYKGEHPEKVFTSSDSGESNSHCLSCHLLHNGFGTEPETFEYTIFSFKINSEGHFFRLNPVFSTENDYVSLRGPPAAVLSS